MNRIARFEKVSKEKFFEGWKDTFETAEEKEMVCFNNPFTMRSCYWSVLLEWTEEIAK